MKFNTFWVSTGNRTSKEIKTLNGHHFHSIDHTSHSHHIDIDLSPVTWFKNHIIPFLDALWLEFVLFLPYIT